MSEFFDELLARTDIVQLINSYVPLKKRGNTHWGCCPFHHEKTPSFSVSADKQLYHCFGCKEGGNALTFVKKMESVETMDAAKILAGMVNMEVPTFNYKKYDGEETAKKRERLYALMKEAAKFYHQSLFDPRAEEAREYLRKREIDKALITRFGLGYSLDGRAVINYLEPLGFTLEEMKEAGLVEISARGTYYDVFYERLIIPIVSAFKEVVGFGGRTLKANPDFAKYRNSSQTLIFDKSKTVYGINLLKSRKLKGIDYVIMVEGYMDVIMLHKAGFDTAVASMGTALTFNQAKQLKNYCDKIFISYDGDAAGQKSTLRGLDILAEAGLNVKVVSLPDGLDPDDVIKQKGRDFYKSLLDEALALPAYKIEILRKGFDLNDPVQKAKFAVEAVKVIKNLQSSIDREEYLKIIQSYTGYSMLVLQNQAEIPNAEPIVPTKTIQAEIEMAAKEEATSTAINQAEMFVLASCAENADYVDWDEDEKRIFSSDFAKKLFVAMRELKYEGKTNFSSIFSKFDNNEQNEISRIFSYRFIEGDGKEKYKDCIVCLKAEIIRNEVKRLNQEFTETKDVNLLKKISELNLRLQELKNGEN